MPMREEHKTDPRLAGLVRRYHTWMVTRDQTVAEHSWQVARVLLAIWPDVPRHLIIHCLTHDLGERASGDLPYPVKRDSAILAAECAVLERKALLEMVEHWSVPTPLLLTNLEKRAFKLAEFIEMAECAWNEVNMGNRYATLILQRCDEALSDRIAELASMGADGAAISVRAMNYWTKRRQQEDAIHA